MTIQEYLRQEIDALIDIIPRWLAAERQCQWSYEVTKSPRDLKEMMDTHYAVFYAYDRIEFITKLLEKFPDE